MRNLMQGSRPQAADSAGLDALIVAFVKAKYLIPFLALLFLIIPETVTGSFRGWSIVVACGLAALGFVSIWRYQRRPTSVRALFFMLDGVFLSLGPVLLLGILNMARLFARNYWLYYDYFYVYLIIFSLIFFYFMLRRGSFLEKLKEQMIIMGTYSHKGDITAQELYEVLMRNKGAKEAVAWTPQRLALILGPVSVAFIGAGAWGGGDYMLYFCFLLAVLFAPIMIALPLRRRIYLQRYLGPRDILIRDEIYRSVP